MTDASDYWMRRQSSNYLRMVRGICDTIGGNAKTVLDVGSLATPILE